MRAHLAGGLRERAVRRHRPGREGALGVGRGRGRVHQAHLGVGGQVLAADLERPGQEARGIDQIVAALVGGGHLGLRRGERGVGQRLDREGRARVLLLEVDAGGHVLGAGHPGGPAAVLGHVQALD